MQTKPFRIGTRGSPLAMAQTHETRDRLAAAHGLPPEMFEIVILSTKGDRITDRSLAEIGGKGLFTEELEHSFCRETSTSPCIRPRTCRQSCPRGCSFPLSCRARTPRRLVGRSAKRLVDLPQGATVGSSSLRRQALIRRLRPDIDVITYRGQVETRLRKLAEGQVDGTLLAYAGLKRLGMEHVPTELLDPEEFPPAPAQGAICVEARIGDDRINTLLAAIDDPRTHEAVSCERGFLATLDGSCRTPIAGYAQSDGTHIRFAGMILTPDGATSHQIEIDGRAADAERLGQEAGERIRTKAGPGFFSSWS